MLDDIKDLNCIKHAYMYVKRNGLMHYINGASYPIILHDSLVKWNELFMVCILYVEYRNFLYYIYFNTLENYTFISLAKFIPPVLIYPKTSKYVFILNHTWRSAWWDIWGWGICDIGHALGDIYLDDP